LTSGIALAVLLLLLALKQSFTGSTGDGAHGSASIVVSPGMSF
jgi:hypothetical protein